MDPSPNQSKTILTREWLAIALVGGVIAILALISWLPQLDIERRVSRFQGIRAEHATIEIQIEGAVNRPGVYSFPPGVTAKEVLKAVTLLKEADRKAVPLRKVFLTSQTLVVPSKKVGSRRRKDQIKE